MFFHYHEIEKIYNFFYKTSNSCFNAFMRPDKLKDHSWMILCGSYSDIPVVKKKVSYLYKGAAQSEWRDTEQ